MKTADQIAAALIQSKTTTHGLPMTPSPISRAGERSANVSELVSRCFDGMSTVCTAWRQATIGDVQEWVAGYKRELAESLIRAGVTDEAGMRVGLSRLKALKRDFLPNPDAFAELCVTPEDLGMPSEVDAYRLALNWSSLSATQRHPAVLATLRSMDSWAFRQMPEDKARKAWRDGWDKTVAKVRAEGTGWLPEITVGELPNSKIKSADEKERGRAMLANVLADLGPPKTRNHVSVEI